MEESIDNVIISSGVPTAALLSFDLNSIEANSILFDADLELIIDVSNSIDFRDDFTQIFVRSVISANNDFSNIEIDSVFTTSSAFNFSLLKVDDGKKLRLSGTDRIDFAKGFIQQVVNSERESQFLYLHYVGDGDDASVLRFFNEKQIDVFILFIIIISAFLFFYYHFEFVLFYFYQCLICNCRRVSIWSGKSWRGCCSKH